MILQDNGKVRLQLSSHTNTQPREVVVESVKGQPNKYRAHVRTWDNIAEKTAASNLTKQDLATLQNAVYENLPEGAELLFPESGPGYYGTRGTVASLLRMSRDPRYLKGSSGILQYMDKDPITGKSIIKTFSGNGFIKPSSEKQSIINSYDQYGLDEIPIVWDPSKGDSQNYLSRHLSRLADMGIDYTTTELVPVSSIKLPDRYYNKPEGLAEQIQKGVNMAASHSNNHIVVSDNPGNIRIPMLSHEIDHIFNTNYENLANGNKYVRQFLDTSEAEAAIPKDKRNKYVDQELLALGSQLKDYLGFTRASQYATPEQYQEAIKNYSKVVGYDNFKGWFDKVLDWEGLTDFWNKNSTVLTGAGVFSILAPYLNNDDK